MTAALQNEIRTFEKLRQRLETEARGKWVVIRANTLVGTYNTFEKAADEAVRRFGRGPYLIRQIGAADMALPAAVVYGVLEDAR